MPGVLRGQCVLPSTADLAKPNLVCGYETKKLLMLRIRDLQRNRTSRVVR